MEQAPGKKTKKRILRATVIDKFQGSCPSCKGFGHTGQGTQKIMEWEKIPESGIRVEFLVSGLNTSKSTENTLTSRLLGTKGSSNTKSWGPNNRVVPISPDGWTEASAPVKTALKTRETQTHLPNPFGRWTDGRKLRKITS